MRPVTVNTDQREIEWQFDADRLSGAQACLARIARRHGLTSGKAHVATHHDTYFDTGDWRVYRAGYALRLRLVAGPERQPGELTLKSLAAAEKGLRERREVTETLESVDRREPAVAVLAAPGPVGERVRAIVGPARLEPIFEIVTHRRAIPLSANGQLAGEIALDETTIAGDRELSPHPARLRRIEIEAAPGMAPLLQPFVNEARKVCRLREAERAKFEIGLAARGLAPASVTDVFPALAQHTTAACDMTLGELAVLMLRQRTIEMLEQEPATRLGDDIEALHAMRVATRRLRSILRLFEDALPEQAAALGEELRWLAGALGETRDLDVHLEQTRAWLASANPQERAALEALERLLEQDRLSARRQMLDALDSARYERLKVSLVSLVTETGAWPRLASKPAIKAMPKLIQRRYRRLRRLADRLSDDSPPPDFHAVRIQCKRLRYALDCAAPLYGKPVRAAIKQLARIQDILGCYQDAQVAIARVRDLCAKHAGDLSAEAVSILNRIAERHASQGKQIRQRFWPAWRKLRHSAWRKLAESLM